MNFTISHLGIHWESTSGQCDAGIRRKFQGIALKISQCKYSMQNLFINNARHNVSFKKKIVYGYIKGCCVI